MEKGRYIVIFLSNRRKQNYSSNSCFLSSYEDAVIDTAQWRKSIGIRDIREEDIHPVVKLGQLYTHGFDHKGRSIIYLKFTESVANIKNADERILLSIMHTIEK
jgi:hypothetical protein